MKVIGVIPSRYASTRLPAKPLVKIAGKPLVRWVWEAASKAETLSEIIIATDDTSIKTVCETFGACVVMTDPACPSGTDRIAQALIGVDCNIVVNIQGDEPLMPPGNIDACVRAILEDGRADVSSGMVAISNESVFTNPNAVKVVTDGSSYALYFSRAPIPDRSRLRAPDQALQPYGMKHLGLYVYRREVLDKLVKLPPSRYEQLEKLEQLRFLEAGYRIKMVELLEDSAGVDTPEDIMEVERRLALRAGAGATE